MARWSLLSTCMAAVSGPDPVAQIVCLGTVVGLVPLAEIVCLGDTAPWDPAFGSGTDGASRAIANGTGRSAEQTAAACSPGALTGRCRRSGVRRSNFRLTGESGSPRSPQLPTTGRMLSRSTRSDGVLHEPVPTARLETRNIQRDSAPSTVRSGAAAAACAPSYEEAAALFADMPAL